MVENEGTNPTRTNSRDLVQHEDISRNMTEDTEDVAIEILLDCKKFMFLAFFLFVIFPLVPVFLAAIFGALFVLCEPDTTFKQGFLYVVSNLLGMANPLTDYNPTGVTVAIILDMYVAITALVVFGIMLNVVNLFEVPKALNSFIGIVTKNEFLKAFIALVILIPIWNAILCAAFGVLLALAEQWSMRDGILYVFTNTLGLGTPLTNVVPTSIGGSLFDIVISSMALGYIAIFADYVTVLNPSKLARRKFRACFAAFGIIELNPNTEHHPLSYDRQSRYGGFNASEGRVNESEKNEDTSAIENDKASTSEIDEQKESSFESQNLLRSPLKENINV